MGRVFIFGFLILVLSACSSYKEDELVVFDTEASYPEREILLSEVCDVTYVPLDNIINMEHISMSPLLTVLAG